MALKDESKDMEKDSAPNVAVGETYVVGGTSSEDSVSTAPEQDNLKRSLKPRHLQMIAIGGVIGTGLFLGTGSDLQHGGPAGLLLGYCIMASLLFSVMTALGEMIACFPITGGQFALAGRFVSKERKA